MLNIIQVIFHQIKNGINWVSSDTKILSVDSSGIVTPVNLGTATIQAISKYNNNLTDSVTLTVIDTTNYNIDGDDSNICPNTPDCYLISCICCGKNYCGAHTEHVCNEIIPNPPNITSCPNTSNCIIGKCGTCGKELCRYHDADKHTCDLPEKIYVRTRDDLNSEYGEWTEATLTSNGNYTGKYGDIIPLDDGAWQIFTSPETCSPTLLGTYKYYHEFIPDPDNPANDLMVISNTIYGPLAQTKLLLTDDAPDEDDNFININGVISNTKRCPNTSSCNVITCQTCGESYCATHKTHTCSSDIEITPDIIYARSRVENDEWSEWYQLEKTVNDEYRNSLYSKFIQFTDGLKKFMAVGAVH